MSVSTGPRCALILVGLASLGWAVSFGLGATLSSLWLKDAGHSAGTIGLNTTLYYLGVALAAPFVPRLMKRGNRACVVVGMALDAIATALFPLVEGVLLWHLLRFVGGVGTALSLIPMETLVNHNAPADRRARDFALYAVCVALGIALGSAAGLPVYPHFPRLAFALGGAVTFAAIALAWIALPPKSASSVAEEAGGFGWRDGALGLGTAWVQGFLEGGTIAFLSIYLLWRGYRENAVGALLGGLFAGVVVAQLPVAWLADRLGRMRVLVCCHSLLLAGLLIVPWLHSTAPLAGWLFVLGATCGALYPLGLALLGERVPASGLARANAWYLTGNCIGSLTGPVVLGVVIDRFGLPAQFAAGAVAVVAVLTIGLSAARRRPVVSADEARRAA